MHKMHFKVFHLLGLIFEDENENEDEDVKRELFTTLRLTQPPLALADPLREVAFL
jgi:hypothetical protein